MKNTQEKNHILSIIKKPRVTEKAGIKSESQNVYTFEVVKNATKKRRQPFFYKFTILFILVFDQNFVPIVKVINIMSNNSANNSHEKSWKIEIIYKPNNQQK